MSKYRNIGVLGLDDFHLLKMLNTVRDAENYTFHGVIPYEKIVNPEHYHIEDLLHIARRELSEIEGGVDAIIGHWDFPTTCLLPILRAEQDLTTTSLKSVLACDNKYINRLAVQEAAPHLNPPFAHLDPRDDAIQDDPPLPYPFWLKPVVAFSSTLGFMIEGREDLVHALERIRAGINKFAEPFNVITRHARLGDRRALYNGAMCVAEGLISGHGTTVEGYITNGEPYTYAVIDSLRGPNKVSFVGYHYPSELPEDVQKRMGEEACRVVKSIGLDNTPFNIEFFWNKNNDELKLLEVNPRISKSHSPLFLMVEGASHHEVAIDVALNRKPEFPHGEGKHSHAAKFMPRVYNNAKVTRLPSSSDVERLKEAFPDAEYDTWLKEGMELSELPNQDSYSFEIAELFLGGNSREDLLENFREAMRLLGFKFSCRVETNYD